MRILSGGAVCKVVGIFGVPTCYNWRSTCWYRAGLIFIDNLVNWPLCKLSFALL